MPKLSKSSESRALAAVNPQVAGLPSHLRQFIVDQKYDEYTPVDHAVWRFIMRQNVQYLEEHAQRAYMKGLLGTGISTERIPSIEQMNRILGEIGWGAVAVDGFIPPPAFMEFQSHRVLVIACDMRQIDHIEYTPAPDIVHEAAGHAPIIVDEEYAEYLRRFGEIGSKAMSSRKDYELYEAIRHLSILKERPDADPDEIASAEKEVEQRQENLGEPSEMAQLSRLHWWTVEYGLIGTLDEPKIFGAGLLSSIGESVNCLKESVKKIPYSQDARNYAFDITTQQPHLFVTPSFAHLAEVLEEFAQSMAFSIGGREGLNRAIECSNVSTAVYSSGLQVSGVFADVIGDTSGEPGYIMVEGPASLAVKDQQLPEQGRERHPEGFSSPVGKLENIATPLEALSHDQLRELGIEIGRNVCLMFTVGIEVKGTLDRIDRRGGRIILMTFSDCTVRHGKRVLFQPEWGSYDMAVGERIVSVFSGAADKDAYDQASLVPRERTTSVKHDDAIERLRRIYQRVRDIREQETGREQLAEIWQTVKKEYSHEWLLPLEISELASLAAQDKNNAALQADINRHLERLAESRPDLRQLIGQGMCLAAGFSAEKKAS